MHGQVVNPEIEKARKELEKLKQREHELEERLSVMYAKVGDTYSTITEEEEDGDGKEEENEIDASEEIYENIYNGQYLQGKNNIKDSWVDNVTKRPLSSINDHRGNSNYSPLACAITDKRAVNPSAVSSRTSDNDEVSTTYPYHDTNELIPQQRSAIIDIISTDGENGEKQDASSSCLPEDSDFEEHLFYHAYEERPSENVIDYYGKGEGDISSSELDDDAVDQRSEIHREIKINQQRERELRYERNMLSDGSQTDSDSESAASALSIRSKILKEIEEDRFRDMEIHNQYRMRGLITNRPVHMESDSTTSFDEALKQRPSEKEYNNSVIKSDINNPQLLSPAGVAGMVLTGGGDASLRSKDNEYAQQHRESMKQVQRVLTEEGDYDTGDSASELSEVNSFSNIDMRSKILQEIEEEQKREKELKVRLRRNAKRNAAMVVPSTTSQGPASITVNQTSTSTKMPSVQPLPANWGQQVLKQNKKKVHCNKESETSKIKTLRGITHSKMMEKTAKSDGMTQGASGTPEYNRNNNGNAGSLSEIDKCTFSSREDLVAFLGIKEAGCEGENVSQQVDVQPLKIPKVFTKHTNGYEMNKKISRKSPKLERKEEYQQRTRIDSNHPVVPKSPSDPISYRNTTDSFICNNTSERKMPQFGFNTNIPQYLNTPHDTDIPEGSSAIKVNRSTTETERNKFSVYFEAENQYLDHSYDEEKSRRKNFEKHMKTGISNRSSKQTKPVKNEKGRGFKSSVKPPSDDGSQRFSKPVTVSYTISKTIQRWERRIKKNAMSL